MTEPTPFNITIDDTAPQIVYTPLITSSVDPSNDLAAGWIPYFNISGFNAFPGEEASGQSLHITSDDGAALAIGFTGEHPVLLCLPSSRWLCLCPGSYIAPVRIRYRPMMSS